MGSIAPPLVTGGSASLDVRAGQLEERHPIIRVCWSCAFAALLFACSPQTARSTPSTPLPPLGTSISHSTPTGTSVPAAFTPTPSPTLEWWAADLFPTQPPTPEWRAADPVAADGVSFSGPIAIGKGASSANLRLAISDDRSSITSVEATLNNLDCGGMSAESMSTTSSGQFPITEGEFAVTASGIGEIQGQVTSPTEASGVIDLRWEVSILGQTLVCELGEWNWTATAQ